MHSKIFLYIYISKSSLSISLFNKKPIFFLFSSLIMASSLMKMAAFLFIFLCIFDASASRVLTGERWLPGPSVSIAVLRGPVPSSSRNPCSFIPGFSRGRCTLSEVEDGDAGVQGGSSAFPGLNADGFAAASMVNQTQKQNSSLSS